LLRLVRGISVDVLISPYLAVRRLRRLGFPSTGPARVHTVVPMSRTRSKTALVAVAGVALYFGGYLYARSAQWLVHRSGFAGGNTDNHSVVEGDRSFGWNADAGVSYYFFTPLRWGETTYWYLRYPTGTPWPY
jgi:hypothetical protein